MDRTPETVDVTYKTCGPEEAWHFVMHGAEKNTGKPVFFLGLKMEPGHDLKETLLFAAKAFIDLQVRVAAQDAAAALESPSSQPPASSVPWPIGGFAQRPRPTAPIGRLLDVVGESHYVAAFETITGGRTYEGYSNFRVEAELAREPNNPFDPEAVVVKVRGLTVGYLLRAAAAAMQPVLLECERRDHRATCQAFINGGWDRTGYDDEEDEDAEDAEDGGDDVGDFGIALDVNSPDDLLMGA